MKISFMTLGCPAWDLDTIIRNGRAYGYQGVDFRGVQSELDVTKLPAFTTDIAKTKKQLDDAGLEVSGISSSIVVCDGEKTQQNIDEARRTIDVAHGLKTINVRVFGGGRPDLIGYEEAARIGRDCVNRILDLPGAKTLKWNFETHDYWIRTEHCRLLLDAINTPAFGALWDLGHTKRVAGEDPAQTWAGIGPRVNYCHVKDARYVPGKSEKAEESWEYVMPGTGQLPLAEGIALLKRNGYNGWLLFEHEKRWHPDLPEPEVAFPAYVKWITPLLK